jgi:hypothetical protein
MRCRGLRLQPGRLLIIRHGVEVKPSPGAALKAAALVQTVSAARGLEQSPELDFTTIIVGATRDGVDHLQSGPGDVRVDDHFDWACSRMPSAEEVVDVTISECRIPRSHQFLSRAGLRLTVVQRPATRAITPATTARA